MSTQPAKIAIRSSCGGTVHIASLKVGRTVVYETRAWGTANNAADDAKSRAAELGLAIAGNLFDFMKDCNINGASREIRKP